jgi:hypothetical protein
MFPTRGLKGSRKNFQNWSKDETFPWVLKALFLKKPRFLTIDLGQQINQYL